MELKDYQSISLLGCIYKLLTKVLDRRLANLQYADDTLCIGKPTVANLWTLKGLLRGFEMVLGLKVNFYKSCLMGVNVTSDFMEMACQLLNCSEGRLPFKYLGLPVGANPSSVVTWDPVLEQLSKKLNSWGSST